MAGSVSNAVSRWFQQEWFKITAYLVVTIVLGALLAPWLYIGCKEVVRQGWIATGPLEPLHSALERSPFSRYFNRAVMIVAALGLIPLIRSLKFQGWADLRLFRNPCRWMDVTAGGLLAAGFLLFMGAGFLYWGLFIPEAETDWGVIPKVMATAIAVGIIEEVFFRGAMLGVCLRKMQALWAVLLTSGIYAFIHYAKPPRVRIPVEEIRWTSGFEILGKIRDQFTVWQDVAGGFLTLLVIGIVLAIMRLRTASLWLPIGLHAGWVFGYQLYNKNTDDTPLIEQYVPLVGEDLKIGLIPLIVIVITGALASLWIDLSRKPTVDPQSAQPEKPSA